MSPVDISMLNLFPQATPVVDKYMLRERVMQREGVKASHLAEAVQLKGPSSTLVSKENAAPPQGFCSGKGLDRCVQQSNASVRKEYPHLRLDMDNLGVKNELPFNIILKREGSHDARQALSVHSPAGPIFQERERLFQGKSTCNNDKEWKKRDGSSRSMGQSLSNRFDVEEVDWTQKMIPHDLSKKTEEDEGLVCHDPNVVAKDSSLSHIGQEQDDAMLLQLPHYSGWESLSIEEALQQMSGVHFADNYVEKCVCLIQKCRRSGCLATGIRMYAHICDNGLEAHGILGSYLIAMFVHSSSLPMAQQAFDRLCHHNEYSWTDLLKGYVEVGDPEHGLNLFSRMKEAGVRPSKSTFVAVLRACATLKCIKRGRQLHTEIVKVLDEDPYVTRALVDFYVKCDLFEEACDVFNSLQVHANDIPITRHMNRRLHENSIDCMDDMQVTKVILEPTTFVFRLKACGSVKDLATGRELHLQVMKEGYDRDRFVSNTLVDMYAKCGLLSEAAKVLSRISPRDVISWTALITGCIEYGQCEDALMYSDTMQKEGVPPNAFTLVSCLKSCGIMRALDRGQKLHAEIMKEGLDMDFVICNSLVDMYAK
eukprot:c23889_g5_i1 orf=478-2265(+)